LGVLSVHVVVVEGEKGAFSYIDLADLKLTAVPDAGHVR
jgi:hypothetical protein